MESGPVAWARDARRVASRSRVSEVRSVRGCWGPVASEAAGSGSDLGRWREAAGWAGYRSVQAPPCTRLTYIHTHTTHTHRDLLSASLCVPLLSASALPCLASLVLAFPYGIPANSIQYRRASPLVAHRLLILISHFSRYQLLLRSNLIINYIICSLLSTACVHAITIYYYAPF